MKDLFPGYFRPTEADFKALWERGTVVLDASVLLGLYRYSEETRKEFLRVLKGFGDRVWVPHRACAEFLRNRPTVIIQQAKVYEETIKGLDEIEKALHNPRQHPFIGKELLKELLAVNKRAKDELARSREIYSAQLSNDPVLEELSEFFSGRVGHELEKAETDDLLNKGKERYEKRIPPGYKDAAKDDDGDSTRRFGDYILWYQIHKYAKEKQIGVIFVLDDRKEDWWLIQGQNTLGPRPELIKEFAAETGQKCYLYQPEHFLSTASKYVGKVSTPAIEEIKQLRADEVLSKEQWLELKYLDSLEAFHREKQTIDLEQRMIDREIAEIQAQIKEVTDKEGVPAAAGIVPPSERLVELRHRLRFVSEQRVKTELKIEKLRWRASVIEELRDARKAPSAAQ